LLVEVAVEVKTLLVSVVVVVEQVVFVHQQGRQVAEQVLKALSHYLEELHTQLLLVLVALAELVLLVEMEELPLFLALD
jgi:hypothetical protein